MCVTAILYSLLIFVNFDPIVGWSDLVMSCSLQIKYYQMLLITFNGLGVLVFTTNIMDAFALYD